MSRAICLAAAMLVIACSKAYAEPQCIISATKALTNAVTLTERTYSWPDEALDGKIASQLSEGFTDPVERQRFLRNKEYLTYFLRSSLLNLKSNIEVLISAERWQFMLAAIAVREPTHVESAIARLQIVSPDEEQQSLWSLQNLAFDTTNSLASYVTCQEKMLRKGGT